MPLRAQQQNIRIPQVLNPLGMAEQLLGQIGDHCGEWNYLMGTICYRRGWVDEARRYFQTVDLLHLLLGQIRQGIVVVVVRVVLPGQLPIGLFDRLTPSSAATAWSGAR